MNTPGSARPSGTVGPYRIERLLGAGGMGVVYLGHHKVTGVAAAVKLIRPEHTADPSFRARLRREIAAAQQVPRFCTVPVLAADVDADPPWVATEYVDAPTLDVALLGAQPLAGVDLETFAVGVAVALQAIHAHGVIHRDLKPSNVLMSPQGPRVIDFGIARPADPAAELTRLTHTGIAIGTPAYMAPEQFTGGAITPAADVYAWARLVRYAATGRPPATVAGETGQSEDAGVFSEPLALAVAAALTHDPAARPTAAELVERLAGRPQPVAPPPAGVVLPAAPPAPPPGLSVHTAPTLAPRTPGQPPEPPASTAAPPAPRARRSLAVLATVVALLAMAAADTGPVDLPIREGPGPDQRERTDAALPAPGSPPPEPPPPFGVLLFEPLTGHTEAVSAVAVTELDGVTVAVTGSSDQTVRVWDLTTGQQLGEPFTGHTGSVTAVAVAELNGDPIVVTGAADRTVRIWDLTTGQQVGQPFAGHGASVAAVDTGELAGNPVAVSGGEDRTVRVWDLATGEQIDQPVTRQTGSLIAVALGERDGVPIAITGSLGSEPARLWDLATGERIGPSWSVSNTAVYAVAIGERDGVPIAVTGGDRSIQAWDLGTGRQIGGTIWAEVALCLAVGELGGVPVAVAGLSDGSARVWSLQ